MFGDGDLDVSDALACGTSASRTRGDRALATRMSPTRSSAGNRSAARRGMGARADVTLDDLRAALAARVDRQHAVWLEEAIADVRRSPQAMARRFPMVGRMVGRAPLDRRGDPADLHAWAIDDAARTLLLVALGGTAGAHLQDLYRFGDAAERRGILRALPYLPIGDRGLGVVEDAIRSNDAADRGRWALRDRAPARCRMRSGAREVRVRRRADLGLDGVPSRVTRDGARMLAAYVLERVAAGRDVPSEVWSVIDLFSPTAEIEAIERAGEPIRGPSSRGRAGAPAEGEERMRIFDAHAHMIANDETTTRRWRRRRQGARRAGVLARPAARRSGRSSTTSAPARVGALRAAQFGMRHHCSRFRTPRGPTTPRRSGRHRDPAALPRQGRRGRGRRDRLRRDDVRRGGRVGDATRAGARATSLC